MANKWIESFGIRKRYKLFALRDVSANDVLEQKLCA